MESVLVDRLTAATGRLSGIRRRIDHRAYAFSHARLRTYPPDNRTTGGSGRRWRPQRLPVR